MRSIQVTACKTGDRLLRLVTYAPSGSPEAAESCRAMLAIDFYGPLSLSSSLLSRTEHNTRTVKRRSSTGSPHN